MGVVSELQSKILTQCDAGEEYLVYRAGLEWHLVKPIGVKDVDNLKSEKLSWNRVSPYHHQVTNHITFRLVGLEGEVHRDGGGRIVVSKRRKNGRFPLGSLYARL